MVPGGYFNVKMRMDFVNMMINMPEQLIFCLGLFSGSGFSLWNDFMKAVEPKIHGPHYNIHALQQHMLMGIHLRNIIRCNHKPVIM